MPGRVVAVIDVGSNSIRLLVARELSPVAFEVIDEERFDARLAQGQAGGLLTSEAMDRGLRAMRIASAIAASYGPSRLVAAGTAALRAATNGDIFLDAVREQTGVRIRVLTADEEAGASFLGAVNSTRLDDGYLVDIGGGSLELMRVAGRNLVSAQSMPLGAISATEHHFAHDPPTMKEVRALRKAVRRQCDIAGPSPVLYAIGGAVRNLARIIRLRRRYPLRRLHGLALRRSEVRRLVSQLVAVPSEDRRHIAGVNASRADILPAAAIVLDELMDLAGAAELRVSGQGLREGLVWQELRGEGAVLPDVRAASISGLATANGVDALAAEPVVLVAAELFQAAQPLHRLDAADLALLLAAARLAGIGMHVDYYNRDRHAEYLVHSGDLHGFSHREIVLLGTLVRWSASGTPDLAPYRTIVDADDTRRAAVLAVLLGIARAVHRRRPSPVFGVSAGYDGERLVLSLRGGDALEPEVAAIEAQQRRFETTLGAKLFVSVGG